MIYETNAERLELDEIFNATTLQKSAKRAMQDTKLQLVFIEQAVGFGEAPYALRFVEIEMRVLKQPLKIFANISKEKRNGGRGFF